MLIYIYGDDSYRISQKSKEYEGGYKEKFGSDLSLQRFDLKEKDSFEELKEFFSVSAMFVSKKMAVLEGISKFSELKELEEFLENSGIFDSENDILVILDILEKRIENKLFKKAKFKHEFNKFRNYAEAKEWIQEQVKKMNLNIEEKALKVLFQNFSSDIWRMINEMKKLSLYKLEQKISEKDIAEICVSEVNPYVFNIFDAFLSNNKKKALYVFSQAIKAGMDPAMIFNLFVDQIRTAVYLTLGREKELKGSYYKIKMIKGKLGNFSKQRILNIFHTLADIDDAVKNGRIDYITAIEYVLMG